MSYISQLDQFFPVTDSIPKINVDSVELVREVRKFPMIYNTWLRRDSYNLCVAWELVVAAVTPNFSTISKYAKSTIRTKIRARWSWMRATFRRNLSRNRLRYYSHVKWMQEMQFLAPSMLARFEAYATKKHSEERLLRSRSYSLPDIASNVVSSTTASSLHQMQQANDPNETLVKAFISTFCMEVLATSANPDENFLITLLHVFRKVSPEQKSILKQKLCKLLEQ